MVPEKLSNPIPQPKPSKRLTDRVAYKKAREEQARVFRAAVWSRDKGRCVVCQRVVKRTLGLDPLRGEVHHKRGRNVAPEARYAVDKAILVCLEHHLQLTARKITFQVQKAEDPR